jgi:pimeloyl-ACP methyl ester carboxylesterase
MALVLVHGFSTSVQKVWSQFAALAIADCKIKGWDVLGAGYTTSLRIDIPHVWAADPGIQTLADGLRTTLSLPPFNRYRSLAIVAHSMGGLVIERAILDDEALRSRLSHLFLFGTPSAGLKKGRVFAALKRQIEDIDADGPFIKSLRLDWDRHFANGTRFFFRAVGGDRDEFVSSTSSLEPFDNSVRAVIAGNHSDIVRPADGQHEGFALVVEALAGRTKPRAAVDGAKLATELGEFQEAVNVLLPLVASIDESALVSLALALDGLGQNQRALDVLEKQGSRLSTTDALGALAGRIKRRWLVERTVADLDRAKSLYRDAYRKSTAASNHTQAFYHAINLAFLELMSSPVGSGVPEAAKEMAKIAAGHCAHVPEDAWSLATEGEAALVMGNLDRAVMFYERALQRTSSPRAIDSMYSQAVRIATRIFGAEGARRVERLFGI